LRHVEDTGQVRLGDRRPKVNDLPNLWPAHAKTRPNAYEIPTWAIANAIRRRPHKAKPVVPDDPDSPQRPDGMAEFVGPAAIALEGARP
jgi:hypothetical protein